MDQDRDALHPRLTQVQLSRLALAERDLREARGADLAVLGPAELILLVERLRGSLHDVIRLVDEVAA